MDPKLEELVNELYKAGRDRRFNDCIRIEYLAYSHIKQVKGEDVDSWYEWLVSTKSLREDLIRENLAVTMNSVVDANYESLDIHLQTRKALIVLPNASDLAHERQLKALLRGKCGQGAILLLPFNTTNQISKSYRDSWQHACGHILIVCGGILLLDIQASSQWLLKCAQKFAADDKVGLFLFPSVLQYSWWQAFELKRTTSDAVECIYISMKLPVATHKNVFDALYRPVLYCEDRSISSRSIQFYGVMYKGLQLTRVNTKDLLSLPWGVRDGVACEAEIKLGSIDREAKKRNPAYLNFCQMILNADERSVLYWTDCTNSLSSRLDKEFPGRIVHKGWVKPADIMASLDIYVDPYPWGGGDMTYLAMAFAIPVISWRGERCSYYPGIWPLVDEVLSNSNVSPSIDNLVRGCFCESPNEAVDRIKALTTNEVFYREVSHAVQLFYRKHVFPNISSYFL